MFEWQAAHTEKLPCKDDHGIDAIKSIRALAKKTLPDNHDFRIILTGSKLGSHFNVKEDRNKQQKHDLVCSSRCPSFACTDNCLGGAGRCPSECVVDHAGRNTKSYIVRHCFNSYHETVSIENFNILKMH